MTTNEKSSPSIEQISTWLTGLHNAEIRDLISLSGGFWSSAYAYRVGTQDLVLRLSDMAEGFAIDAEAMRFKGPNLPVPNVIDTGKVLGFNYAISERHYGRFIETTSANEGNAVGSALETLLAALRAVATSENDGVTWYAQEGSTNVSWHGWLTNGLVDNPAAHVSGWRTKLAENPVIDNVFERCVSRIHELLPACPERRDLVHG
ncbi:MAG: hypothetical protein GY943_38000, partial [Chloroflexi bacterium]|nr:hypothetical protein [Chloroflexota bacterium]